MAAQNPNAPVVGKPFPLHPESYPNAMRPVSLKARRLQQLKDANKARRILQSQPGNHTPVTAQRAIVDEMFTPKGVTFEPRKSSQR